MVKPINEVVLTGHDDSLSRKFRKTIKGRRHLKGDDSRSKPDPAKRPIPKIGRKSNNNKPQRKKVIIDKQKIHESFHEAIDFITTNQGKPLTIEMIRPIKDKLRLQSMVNRMLPLYFNNWKVEEGKVTNGIIVADNRLWTVKDGLLYSNVTGERPPYFEWLYNLRATLESTIIEDIDTIKGHIKCQIKSQKT